MNRCTDACRLKPGQPGMHCTKCHYNFYTEKSFNEHRNDPDTPEDQNVDCWMPEDCDLIFEKNMWAFPHEHEKRRNIEAKLEKARASRGSQEPIIIKPRPGTAW